MSAPLRRTAHPGVYRRGSRYVAVYRRGGRQRKESAPSFAAARALKRRREAEERSERLGPTLHEQVLDWVESSQAAAATPSPGTPAANTAAC